MHSNRYFGLGGLLSGELNFLNTGQASSPLGAVGTVGSQLLS